VVRLVLRQGGLLTALGISLGVGAAVPLVRFVRSMLFDVQPLDAGVFAAATVFLAVVAIAAMCVPAMRASRVDPLIALRAE
jgi:putative ABC transport system permease protein